MLRCCLRGRLRCRLDGRLLSWLLLRVLRCRLRERLRCLLGGRLLRLRLLRVPLWLVELLRGYLLRAWE